MKVTFRSDTRIEKGRRVFFALIDLDGDIHITRSFCEQKDLLRYLADQYPSHFGWDER